MANNQFENIPAELRERDQWVTWKLINGTKVPFNARTGKAASSTDPATWATFDEACMAASIATTPALAMSSPKTIPSSVLTWMTALSTVNWQPGPATLSRPWARTRR